MIKKNWKCNINLINLSMALYLSKNEIYNRFSRHITKKELKIQVIGATITVNGEQIVILSDENWNKIKKDK